MEQVRRINERHQQLHAASVQFAAINVPTVTVPPELFESVNSAKVLAKQFAAINVQTVTVPPKLYESINSASVLAKQFAAIKAPTVTVPPDLFESVNTAKVLAKQFAAINVQIVTVPPKLFESVNAANVLAKQFAAIRVPTVTVPPKLFESVNAANVLAKQFVAIRVPTVPVPPKLFESVNLASVLPKQFVIIKAPTLKDNKKFSEFLERTQPLTQGAMSGCESRPMPLDHRGIEFVPKIAVTRSTVRKLTPAKDVVTRIYEEFDRRRALDEDRRHEVAVVVTLLTGKRLLVESITTNGDHLIRIVGKVNSERRIEVVSGFASLQYEIITVEHRPSRPDLRIVH